MIKNFLLSIIALVFITGIDSVGASDGYAIEFVSENITSQFPDGILFEAVFESTSPVDEIRVFYVALTRVKENLHIVQPTTSRSFVL